MVAANGIYKFAVLGTVNGQQHIHTLHFRSTAAPDSVALTEPAFMDDLLTNWRTDCLTAYRGIFNTGQFPAQTYQVRKVCGTLPLPAGLDAAGDAGTTEGTQNPGVGGGDIAAPWLANVVTERSALAGRRNRGRFFLGGLYEGDFLASDVGTRRITPTQAYNTALMGAFVTPIELDVNQKLFVFSRVQAALPGIECQNAGADVVSLQAQTYLSTMRSRRIGSGI